MKVLARHWAGSDHDQALILTYGVFPVQGLSDWRSKLNEQVSTYQEEMNGLNTALKSEVGQLRQEFNVLRSSLRQQMELTVKLAQGESKDATITAKAVSPQKAVVLQS